VQIGYALSSEEHPPDQLVEYACLAEQSGFGFAVISDHYHPWVSQQGQSAFVWSTLGGIAQATERLEIGTGVTCPTIRIHPALVAQAAATTAAMLGGRFFLGLGTGEYLNEHIYGDPWPTVSTRQEMLAEAIEIIRKLWKGEEISHDGRYYQVVDAQIFALPEAPPPIYVAASDPATAELAGKLADGLISTVKTGEVVEAFRDSGGRGKPCIGRIKVCWADTVEAARETMQTWWPISSVSGLLHVDLPTPRHFEEAIELMSEPRVPEDAVLGPDPEGYLEGIEALAKSGYDRVYIHQVGPDQKGFLEFYSGSLLPELKRI
jgi:G6PDH family F420-dependent oxidoreductase